MLNLSLIALALTAPTLNPPAQEYSPLKGAFAKVVSYIKAGQGSNALNFYRGTSLYGGVLLPEQKFSYTISPGTNGSIMAYVGSNLKNGAFKIEVTSGGVNALSDSNTFGGIFSVVAGKSYTITTTNKSGQAYLGVALMWTAEGGAAHDCDGITTAIGLAAQAIDAARKQGFIVPRGSISLQGGVLNESPQHKVFTMPGLSAKTWIAMATCDGASGDLKLTAYDSSKHKQQENPNANDVAALEFGAPLTGGALRVTGPTNKPILAVGFVMTKG